MAGQKFTLTFDANFNVSQMKGALADIQKGLNNLSLPQNITKGLQDTFNRLYKPYEDNITQSLTAFRERIIKAKGIIPKNSSSTEKIKGYMQGFKKSLNYSHNAENLKTCGYRTNPIEEEAYAVQLDLLEDLELMI